MNKPESSLDEWRKEAERLADDAIHAYAAWLAEFTGGDLQSLHVDRLNDEKDAARRAMLAHLAAHPSNQVQEPVAGMVPVDLLRQHWLRAVECDHEGKQDKPHCACCSLDLGWHPSVGAAVEAWLAHVQLAASQAVPSEQPIAEQPKSDKANDLVAVGTDLPPAPSEDARDAARYRWLRATTNFVTSKGQRIDVRNQPELWDAALDGAIERAAREAWVTAPCPDCSCSACGGTGLKHFGRSSEEPPCEVCHGTGRVA